jgi:hypothetical protein
MSTTKSLFADSFLKYVAIVTQLRNEWRMEDQKESKKRGNKSFEPGGDWYRGVSSASYDLKPKVYRKSGFEAVKKYGTKKTDEDEIRRAFKSSAVQLMTEPHLPDDEKGWYFLMQHYGTPTRLLDWTDGALLALYFAVRELKTHEMPQCGY